MYAGALKYLKSHCLIPPVCVYCAPRTLGSAADGSVSVSRYKHNVYWQSLNKFLLSWRVQLQNGSSLKQIPGSAA